MIKNQEKQPEPPKKKAKASSFSVLGIALALTIVIVPVLTVPIFFETQEFPRQLFLLLMASALTLIWLGGSIRNQELTLVGGKKNLLWVLPVALVGLSTLASGSQQISFFGGDVMNESLLTVIALAFVGFVATQWASEGIKRLENLVWYLLAGNILALVAAIARIVNNRLAENTVAERYLGNPSSDHVALFFAWMLPLALFVFVQYKGVRKGIGALLLLMNGAALVLWATPSVWFVVSVGLFSLLILFWIHAREISRVWNTVVTAIFFLTVFMWATPLGSVIDHPTDVRIGNTLSWQIAKDALAEKPLLGFGPAMYVNVSTQFLPADVYNNVNADIVFSKAGNEVASLVATMGLVSVLLLIAVCAWGAVMFGRFVATKKTPAGMRGHELLLLPLPMIAVSAFLFPLTVALTSTAVFLGVVGIAWYILAKNLSAPVFRLENFPSLSFMLSFLLGIIGVGVLAVGFYGVQAVRASVLAYQATVTENADELFAKSEKAIRIASWDFRYALLFMGASEQRMVSENVPENAVSDFLAYLETQERAGDPLLARRVAESYSALSPALDGSFDAKINGAWEEVLRRYSYHAGVRIVFADTLLSRSVTTEGEEQKVNQEYVVKARTVLDEALVLNPQSEEAKILQAKALVIEAKTTEATALLENFIQSRPRTVSVRLALGALYQDTAETQKAIDVYTEVLTLNASNPIALVERARAYEAQGKLAEALADTEQLQKIYPDNTDIAAQVERLKTAVPPSQ